MRTIIRLIISTIIGALVPLVFILARHYKDILKINSNLIFPDEKPEIIIFWLLGTIIVYLLFTLSFSKEESNKKTNSGS